MGAQRPCCREDGLARQGFELFKKKVESLVSEYLQKQIAKTSRGFIWIYMGTFSTEMDMQNILLSFSINIHVCDQPSEKSSKITVDLIAVPFMFHKLKEFRKNLYYFYV